MGKEVFQLKPNFYGIGIDLRALYERWKERSGQAPSDSGEVATVARRFLQMLAEHGVPPASIPQLLPILRYEDLRDEASLLSALTPEILGQAASLFGVRMAWLTGADDVIYDVDYSYKSPSRLGEKLAQLKPDIYNLPLRALSTSKYLDRQASHVQRLELVAVEPIATIDETTIYRFHPFADGWEWKYEECRIQLKAMVRALGHPVPLYEVTQEKIELAYSGGLFYRSALRGALITDPSLEDYAMTPVENVHAKEIDEMHRVRMYMREHGLKRGTSTRK